MAVRVNGRNTHDVRIRGRIQRRCRRTVITDRRHDRIDGTAGRFAAVDIGGVEPRPWRCAPERSGIADQQRGDASGTLSVEQALECLSEEQRLAVALVLIEGLPYKEAAQIIGVPMGTLTSRLARARQALQQLLGPGDGA